MSDVNIELVGDEELMAVLKSLPYKVQQKVLKRVVNDSANPMIKELRRAAPSDTGGLKRSIGKVAGRSKSSAVVFAGPRIGKTRKGQWMGYKALFHEYSREQERKPTRGAKALVTPMGVRRKVGAMPKRPFVKAAQERTLKVVENNIIKSIRKIIEKEFRKTKR